jgi:chromosome partitioning protein
MIKICLSNRKGGVSKTTTAVNMSSILTEIGYKVLLIDLDAQGDSTQNLNVDCDNLEYTIYDVLVNDLPITNAIIHTAFNIDLVGANKNLANAEIQLHNKLNRDSLLSMAINKTNLPYDFIIFDLPPDLGLLSINGLVATDEVIIPVDIGIFSLTGINELISLMGLIKKGQLNTNINLMGVLITKVDNRTNLSKEIESILSEALGNKVFKTQIRQNIKIADSQSKNKPINHFDKTCTGYLEYKEFVKEVLDKCKINLKV